MENLEKISGFTVAEMFKNNEAKQTQPFAHFKEKACRINRESGNIFGYSSNARRWIKFGKIL